LPITKAYKWWLKNEKTRIKPEFYTGLNFVDTFVVVPTGTYISLYDAVLTGV